MLLERAVALGIVVALLLAVGMALKPDREPDAGGPRGSQAPPLESVAGEPDVPPPAPSPRPPSPEPVASLLPGREPDDEEGKEEKEDEWEEREGRKGRGKDAERKGERGKGRGDD